jgi:hypothetical protein
LNLSSPNETCFPRAWLPAENAHAPVFVNFNLAREST